MRLFVQTVNFCKHQITYVAMKSIELKILETSRNYERVQECAMIAS